MGYEIRQGDWIEVLRTMPDESVQCVVTSPPYWGLRDYGVSGQLGLERTPEEYVAKMVEGFREVRRVLCSSGTLWLNLGDSYAGSWGNYHPNSPPGKHGQRVKDTARWNRPAYSSQEFLPPTANLKSCKPKDLVGIPWMVAFALRSDGWYLRQDIIWSKPNPMPESVRDRCTKAHEYIFLLSKSERYLCDMEAIAEQAVAGWNGSDFRDERDLTVRPNTGMKPRMSLHMEGTQRNDGDRWRTADGGVAPRGSRNKRSVWSITTSPFPEAHFATFPPEIPKTCIKAGCPEGGTVLDPFNGAGTTGLVAVQLGRNYVGIELNPEYIEMSKRRIEPEVEAIEIRESQHTFNFTVEGR